jgi:REP element-mobilizing transposase RayT
VRRNRLAIFLHLVWATWDRLPLIDAASERRLFREIESEAVRMHCIVLALNGMPDHVHIVLIMPSTVSIADLVKQLKGASAHFFNQVLQPEMPFKWQGSYGAFTVSRWDVERIVAYVKNQKRHHEDATLLPDWEETYEEVKEDRNGAVGSPD